MMNMYSLPDSQEMAIDVLILDRSYEKACAELERFAKTLCVFKDQLKAEDRRQWGRVHKQVVAIKRQLNNIQHVRRTEPFVK